MSEPHRLTLLEAADAVATGAPSSVEPTRYMLAYIDRLEPRLRSYATAMPDSALAPRSGGRR